IRTGPRAEATSTTSPRWVTTTRPAATSRCAAARAASIRSRQSSGLPTARAASEGQIVAPSARSSSRPRMARSRRWSTSPSGPVTRPVSPSCQPRANAPPRSLDPMDGRDGIEEPRSAADVAARLGSTGYLSDDALATVTYLALRMRRPLLLEGEPGTGKTALAEAVAESLGLPLVRLQCYEGIDATQALYDWDFPRQILHLRALEAAGGADVEEAAKSLYDARFLLSRPALQALQQDPAVLLVDEVERAVDEFEAFLLEVLSTYQVTIPELGTVRATTPPVVVLTSNRTREVHDALNRRCLYHWIDHPSLAREVAIVRSRAPEVAQGLAEQLVALVQRLRTEDLVKAPGVAETLDWARALDRIGTTDLDVESAAMTLGAAVKYREDAERVRAALDRMLA